MGWFRLLAGLHECSDPDWEPTPTDPPDKKPPTRTYKPGDVFYDDSMVGGKNLADRFGHEKFQYLGEVEPQRIQRAPTPAPRMDTDLDLPPASVQEIENIPPPPPPVPNFDAMSMGELRAYAEAEEIDLSHTKGRAATIKRIKEARNSRVT